MSFYEYILYNGNFHYEYQTHKYKYDPIIIESICKEQMARSGRPHGHAGWSTDSVGTGG